MCFLIVHLAIFSWVWVEVLYKKCVWLILMHLNMGFKLKIASEMTSIPVISSDKTPGSA